MQVSRRASLIRLAAATAAIKAWPVRGQVPGRPIRLVVGFPPGGPNDILARIVAPKLGELLQTNVIVDNEACAAGSNRLGGGGARTRRRSHAAAAARQAHAISPASYSNLPFDPIKDSRRSAWSRRCRACSWCGRASR